MKNIKYAEQYSLKEKVVILSPVVVILLVVFYLVFFVLKELSQPIHCYELAGINAFSVVWGGLFIGFPVLLLLNLLYFEAKNMYSALFSGRYPHPNNKVFVKSKIITGVKARIKGFGLLVLFIFVICFGIWGGFQIDNRPSIKQSDMELCKER